MAPLLPYNAPLPADHPLRRGAVVMTVRRPPSTKPPSTESSKKEPPSSPSGPEPSDKKRFPKPKEGLVLLEDLDERDLLRDDSDKEERR